MVELGIMYFLAFMFALNGLQLLGLRNESQRMAVREERVEDLLKRINRQRRRIR